MACFTYIAEKEIKAAITRQAKKKPLFKKVFHDLREKAKKMKDQWEKEAGKKLQKRVVEDLKSKDVEILGAKLSLGKYKGSRFVTSFKLKVQLDSADDAEDLAKYLRSKYSPKWKLKKVSDEGVALYNVR